LYQLIPDLVSIDDVGLMQRQLVLFALKDSKNDRQKKQFE